jgi:hypothetical protein
MVAGFASEYLAGFNWNPHFLGVGLGLVRFAAFPRTDLAGLRAFPLLAVGRLSGIGQMDGSVRDCLSGMDSDLHRQAHMAITCASRI